MTDEAPRKIHRPDAKARFPALSLPEALERARQFYAMAQTHEAPVPAAAKAWNYSEKSSGASTAVSSLKYFGLLEDRDSGPKRRLKLSDLALRIIRDPREASPERDELIKQAALNPAIHGEIYTHFKGLPPSNDILNAHLFMDRGMADDAAKDFREQFWETVRFAGIDRSDKVDSGAGATVPPEPEKPPEKPAMQTVAQPTTATPLLPAPPQPAHRVRALDDGEPYRVTFTPKGVEIMGRISDPESADDLIATINALKLLLRRADSIPAPTAEQRALAEAEKRELDQERDEDEAAH
jgi:hypothetical protein